MTRYYHGGVPGMRSGDLLEPRPANDTSHLVDGCPVCEARRASAPLDYDRNHRFDRVYITTDKHIARCFAAGYPRGDVYLVEAVGDLEADPEHPDSFAVPAARVKYAMELAVRKMTPAQMRRWVQLAVGR